jgi:hypothetical protein
MFAPGGSEVKATGSVVPLVMLPHAPSARATPAATSTFTVPFLS